MITISLLNLIYHNFQPMLCLLRSKLSPLPSSTPEIQIQVLKPNPWRETIRRWDLWGAWLGLEGGTYWRSFMRFLNSPTQCGEAAACSLGRQLSPDPTMLAPRSPLPPLPFCSSTSDGGLSPTFSPSLRCCCSLWQMTAGAIGDSGGGAWASSCP